MIDSLSGQVSAQATQRGSVGATSVLEAGRLAHQSEAHGHRHVPGRRLSTTLALPARLLHRIVRVHEHEAPSLVLAALSMFCVLGSYFVVVPLREDAAISLGTHALPKLFVGSLVGTLLMAPAASAALARPSVPPPLALRALFRWLAAAMAGFWLLYYAAELAAAHAASSADIALQHQPAVPATAMAAAAPAPAAGGIWPLSALTPGSAVPARATTAGATVTAAAAMATGADFRVLQPASARGGAAPAAEADADADRMYGQQQQQRKEERGELQVAHRRTALDAQQQQQAVAAAIAAAAGPVHPPLAGSGSKGIRPAAAARSGHIGSLSKWDAALRVAFYVWLNVQNLVAASSMWARCAEVFPAEAAGRLFGAISAGATAGQLVGSVVTLTASALLLLASARSAAAAAAAAAAAGGGAGAGTLVVGGGTGAGTLVVGGGTGNVAAGPPIWLLLLSSGLYIAAGELQLRMRKLPAAPASLAAPSSGPLHASAAPAAVGTAGADGPGAAAAATAHPAAHAAPAKEHLAAAAAVVAAGGGPVRRALDGVRLCLASRFLRAMSAYILLTYVVGSLMYLQRVLVVAKQVQGGAAGRTAFFAALHGSSAAAILALQLAATGRIIPLLGIQLSLLLMPLLCGAGLVAIGGSNSTLVVAAMEVLRKVVGYVVVRPAREVLFTSAGRAAQYAAKPLLEPVMQRLGDVAAAGAFELLHVRWQMGPGAVAAAGAASCVAWAWLAAWLAREHRAMQQGTAAHV